MIKRKKAIIEPKVNPINVYIQEAFYRGWCFGFSYCHTARRSKEQPTEAMINSYKKQKAGIKAAVRQSLKREVRRRRRR